MVLPNLEELLKQKTVLLLGAGASMDYNFPLWGDLRDQLLQTLNGEAVGSEEHAEEAKFWLKVIEENRDRLDKAEVTIDEVIAKAKFNDVLREYIGRKVEAIIVLAEKMDGSARNANTRWIDQLRVKFEALLQEAVARKDDAAVLRLLTNFKVVSLNYDRCFAYNFYPPLVTFFTKAFFEDPHFLRNNKGPIQAFFTVDQPHGSLGTLPIPTIYTKAGNPIVTVRTSNANWYSNYGTLNINTPYGNAADSRGMIEFVGEQDMTKNYKNINSTVLKDAKTCLAIGLSHAGINAAKIEWPQLETVYYSDKNDPKLGGNFEMLGMYAQEIVDNL